MDLISLIKKYYEIRKLKWPDIWQALAFSHTEISEVYELLLAREGGWIRNHPENKSKFYKEMLAQELGDAIMMLIVAGIIEGVDPVSALGDKISERILEYEVSHLRVNSEKKLEQLVLPGMKV